MRNAWTFGLLCLCFIGVAKAPSLSAADDETTLYSIVLPQFPVIGTCAYASDYAAKAFSTRTGFPVVRTECHENKAIFSHEGPVDLGIVLFYRAVRRLHQVAIGDPTIDNEELGSYTSKELCVADQTRQTELFRKATGFQPIFAYCFNNRWISSHGWTFHAQGYGNPIKKPQIFTYNLGITPSLPDTKATVDAVTKGFESEGGVVANAFFRWNDVGSYSELVVRYYSESPSSIYVWHLDAPDFANCNALRQISRQVFITSNFQTLSDVCTVKIGGAVELNVFSMAGGWIFSDDNLPFSYDSYSQCAADLKHAIVQYSVPDGYQMNGAFCDGTTLNAQIRILLSPKIRSPA